MDMTDSGFSAHSITEQELLSARIELQAPATFSWIPTTKSESAPYLLLPSKSISGNKYEFSVWTTPFMMMPMRFTSCAPYGPAMKSCTRPR